MSASTLPPRTMSFVLETDLRFLCPGELYTTYLINYKKQISSTRKKCVIQWSTTVSKQTKECLFFTSAKCFGVYSVFTLITKSETKRPIFVAVFADIGIFVPSKVSSV